MKRGAEFSVFQGGSPSRRVTPPPANLNLRKQKSLTDLALQGEAEWRASALEPGEAGPRWGSPKKAATAAAAAREGAEQDEGGRRGHRVRSLSLSLSRTLSVSEHSLHLGAVRGLGARPGVGRQGGEAGAPDRARGDGAEQGGDGRSGYEARATAPRARHWVEELEEEEEGGCGREGAAHLDQEVILTMLGDLQQALHTHPVREDPEARRMRTVRNIADLRQNLEETMSSLRGTQVTHSALETTFDSTVTTEVNGRAVPGLASRSSPMCWRLGQSPGPRLQASDAPSLPGSYSQPRAGGGSSAGSSSSGGGGGVGGGAGRYSHADSSRLVYTAPLRRAAAGLGQRGAELGEKGGADGGPEAEVGGYLSDGDLLGKNARADDISGGYLTDGGLGLYSRNAGRAPELAASRDVIQRGVNEMQAGADSWDDSSSVSSGLSDTLDNIGTDDLNTPCYSNISASPHKSKHPQPKTDAQQRSGHEVCGWDGAEDLKKGDEGPDGVMDSSSKWKPSPSSSSSSPGQYEDPDRTRQGTGSWRRGMTAQVGITPPRTKGAAGTLKTAGKTDDPKVSEKDWAPSKSSGIQRSPSDAGKSSGDEGGKKAPSATAWAPATTASFGFKKAAGPAGALITAQGPKPPATGKGGAGGGGDGARKTSLDLDGSEPQDDGALQGSRAPPPQYRSLPRPAKSSPGGGAVAGRVGGAPLQLQQRGLQRQRQVGRERGGRRQAQGRREGGLRALQPRHRNPGPSTLTSLRPRSAGCLAPKPAASPAPLARPTRASVPRLWAAPRVADAAAQSRLPLLGDGQPGQCPERGHESLYGRAPDLGTSDAPLGLGQSPSSSPASGLSLASGGRPWPSSLSGSSAGSKDTLSCQSMTSLHTSSESIELGGGYHGSLTGLASGPKVTRTGSVKSTLSEGMPLDRNTLPKKGLRYL
ncbi:hypothetical protein AAFF_G00323040 [Aldrovandia affinis]|uniref:Neuron navigator 3 n=1 Tax=Aldrovandia affinis TaxID=143900 RepID=A0AAD7WQI8_9TELE|nr:hypothetical protein AAFF_G00323040 [Aldrovandia affinis]